MYYENQFNKYKSDIKKTWGVINSILKPNNKREYPSSFIIDNEHVSDKQRIANHFNNFFASIGSNLDPLPPVSDPNSFNNFLTSRAVLL